MGSFMVPQQVTTLVHIQAVIPVEMMIYILESDWDLCLLGHVHASTSTSWIKHGGDVSLDRTI